MRHVERWQLADGSLHDTPQAARGTAKGKYQRSLDSLAKMFANQISQSDPDLRSRDLAVLIDENLDRFVSLVAMKEDAEYPKDD